MELQTIKDWKKRLERSIFLLVSNFEKETATQVDSIDIFPVSEIGDSQKYVAHVRVDISIP
jgi:hypothetical protein